MYPSRVPVSTLLTFFSIPFVGQLYNSPAPRCAHHSDHSDPVFTLYYLNPRSHFRPVMLAAVHLSVLYGTSTLMHDTANIYVVLITLIGSMAAWFLVFALIIPPLNILATLGGEDGMGLNVRYSLARRRSGDVDGLRKPPSRRGHHAGPA